MTQPHLSETREALGKYLVAWRNRALLVGAVGLVGCGIAYVVAAEHFFPAYLVSFLFWLGISLGALAVSMLHHVTGGGWGVAVRRIVESAGALTVLMALFALPIVVGIPNLYVWAIDEVVAHDEIIQRKSHYLSVTPFLIRMAVYFALWIFFALLLNSMTSTDDSGRQEARQRPLAIISAIGLVTWGLTVTFASVDWGMSIEPHWFSSMYGVLYMAGQAVSALAWSILVAVALRQLRIPFNVLSTSRLHDLGNLLLAMVMFWSYVSFMQFLIIWSGNLPEETPWYIRRSHGGWQFAVMILMGLHFALPMLLLLMRQTKRRPERIVRLALLLLAMRFIDLCWLIIPTYTPALGLAAVEEHSAGVPPGPSSILHLWPLVVTIPGIGGIWIAAFSWILARRAAIAVHDFPTHETHHELAGHPAT